VLSVTRVNIKRHEAIVPYNSVFDVALYFCSSDALFVSHPSVYFWFGLVYGFERHCQQYFSYIVAVSFISGRNRCTRRKPPTFRNSEMFSLVTTLIYR